MKTWIADIIDEELLPQRKTNESNAEFIQRICSICLIELENEKRFSPMGFGESVIDEIEEEVKEVFRIKTYGHYNIESYRLSLLKKFKLIS